MTEMDKCIKCPMLVLSMVDKAPIFTCSFTYRRVDPYVKGVCFHYYMVKKYPSLLDVDIQAGDPDWAEKQQKRYMKNLEDMRRWSDE